MTSSSTVRPVTVGLARAWRLASPRVHADGVATADVHVADLEDGVEPERRSAERAVLADWLASGAQAWVRVNPAGSDDWATDLDLVASSPGVLGVMLAMTENAAHVEETFARIDVPVVPLIETAKGLLNAAEVAAAGVARIAFGTGDFCRDLELDGNPDALLFARSQLVIVSRAHGLAGPVDGPATSPDHAAIADSTRYGRSLGMTGRMCTSDDQTEIVQSVLSPSGREIEAAQQLLAAPPTGYRGSIGPRLAQARALLERASAYGLG